MSARKSSHCTIFLIVSSGSPLALIASSLRSISKKPFCPMTRSLHPPMTACAHRVRFAGTWREEFFEAPTSVVGARAPTSEATRWGQLVLGIICMVMIANLQYGWTLFVNPIDQKYHWGRAAIQVAFTIFVLTETWLVPIEGYLIDKFGPRIMISGSGVLVAIAWVINSVADSLFLLYLGAANC